MNLMIKFLLFLGIVSFSHVATAETISCPTPKEIKWQKVKPFKKGSHWKGEGPAGWIGTGITSVPTQELILEPAHEVNVVQISHSSPAEWRLFCSYHNKKAPSGVAKLFYTAKEECKVVAGQKSFNCPGATKTQP